MDIAQMLELIAKLQILVSLLMAQQEIPSEAPVNAPVAVEALEVGESVQTVAILNVRESYGVTQKLLGQQPAGALGSVIGISPVKAGDYYWMPVDFVTGVDGWVASSFLTQASLSSAQSAEVENTPGSSAARRRSIGPSSGTPVIQASTSPATSTEPFDPIATACSLRVLTPNGGETFDAGDDIAISWSGVNTSSSSTVVVSLIRNGVIVDSHSVETANDGSVVLSTLFSIAGASNYKVRVQDSGDANCVDASNEAFRINFVSDPDEVSMQCAAPTLTFDPADFDQVIDDYESTKTVSLTGSEWDNTLIRNCYFHDVPGDGIVLRDVDNVVITGCEFENIGGQAAVRGSISGGTSNVTLYQNTVTNTANNGFNFGQRVTSGINHTNLRIIDNTVTDTGVYSSDGSTHAMYIQSQDFLISGNTITGNRDGNGISVRSSGEVSCNAVSGVSQADKPGIRYYSDHQVGPSDQLKITGNVVRGAKSGINIFEPVSRYDGSTGYGHVVKNFLIQSNDVRGNDTPVLVDSTYSSSPFTVTLEGNRTQ